VLAATFVLLAAVILGFYAWSRIRAEVASSRGICSSCGYPRNASGERCSECGMPYDCRRNGVLAPRRRFRPLAIATVVVFVLGALVAFRTIDLRLVARASEWCLVRAHRYGPPTGCLWARPTERLIVTWPDGVGAVAASYSITPAEYYLRHRPSFRYSFASVFWPGSTTPGELGDGEQRCGCFTFTSDSPGANWVASVMIGDHELRTVVGAQEDLQRVRSFMLNGAIEVVRVDERRPSELLDALSQLATRLAEGDCNQPALIDKTPVR